MNLNSDDYYSRNFTLFQLLVSDGERRKPNKSPTPKNFSNDHSLIKDDHLVEHTDSYLDDMKKGTSNIMVY